MTRGAHRLKGTGPGADLARVLPHDTGAQSVGRLFAGYAALSVLPVVLLGVLIATSEDSQATARGLAEARAMATLIASTSVQPLLDGRDLRLGVSATTASDLRRVTMGAVRDGSILHLRVRDLNGRVVFSDNSAGLAEQDDLRAVRQAAAGRSVQRLTREGSDSTSAGTLVVETYQPLLAGTPERRVGVLEVYLPYAPIQQDIQQGLQRLYRNLALGLGTLYVVLGGLAFTTTRRLSRQSEANAYLADHDQLTGLVNRRAFEQRLNENAWDQHGAAVGVVNLDRFKDINETIGHRGGDLVLVELGRRLAEGVDPGDLVARLNGDEFGVLLAGVTSEQDATRAWHGLRSVLAEPLHVGDLPLSVEASIGYVLAPDDGAGTELLERADIALDVAKARRAGVVRYDSQDDHFDSGRLALVGELRRALQDDELVLHYQPTLHLRDDRVRAAEALVRWHHPRLGLLYPDAFIPAAEQTGLIDPLTDWVLRAALRQVGEWERADVHLDVAVNVSARNLTSPGFADRVLAALAGAGIPAQRLELEVTETALFSDIERASLELHRLCESGIRISLDDFGQGQTSLSFLARLPLNELKVDRAFVSGMAQDPANAAIVLSIIDLAHNLGISVVAEGVEDEVTLQALRGMRCDTAQGYVIARPMPGGDVPAWLDARAVAAVR